MGSSGNPHLTGKSKKRIGIIGAGSRGIITLGTKIIEQGNALGLHIRALADCFPQRLDEAQRVLAAESARHGQSLDVFLSNDYRAVIDHSDVDAVMITTPEFAHRAPFEYALQKGKPIYCDKPLAHSLDDAQAMWRAWKQHGRKGVILGFTRRYEHAWLQAKRLIDDGRIGDMRMILLRCVIPGAVFFHKWFRLSKNSGDVLNEKSAHHFDAINWFAEAQAARLSAMGGRSVYDPREGYPKYCRDCDRDCPYRAHAHAPVAPDQPQAQFDSTRTSQDPLTATDACVHATDSDIMDHAVVNIAYDNDVKAQLFLSIAGFPTEDQETLEVVGTAGRLLLTRHTGALDIVFKHGKKHEQIDARSDLHATSHFGADYTLVQRIADLFVHGIEPDVTVEQGYQATRMAAAAVRSCKTGSVFALDEKVPSGL